MAITNNDIKLFQAQDNTDNDSGGGSRTANEVVDGEVNNLFPDISRIDTVGGDVGLRKVFPVVSTTNQDVYYGAHTMLRQTPTDPNVSALIFHTDAPHDRRIDAQNAIESYVTASYTEEFYLFGKHVVNSKTVTFLEFLTSRIPDVGEIYLLKEGQQEQYIKIVSVQSDEVIFNYSFGQTTNEYTRRRLICEIEQPLNFAFTGSDFHPTGQVGASADTWATQVADAARFYGTKSLFEDADMDSTTIKVDDIFEQLVPAAKTQTPLVNKTALVNNETIIPTGRLFDEQLPIVSDSINLPIAIVPNSITYAYSGNYNDDGNGNLINTANNNIIVGSVDYKTGTITLNYSVTGAVIVRCEIGTVFEGETQFTYDIQIKQDNVGNVFTRNISPLPSTGNVYVDYRSNGKWYRFTSNGGRSNGIESIGGNANIGAGQLNDNGDGTGTVSLTLANLPDIDSSVIISWGSIERITTPATSNTYTSITGGDVIASIPDSTTASLDISLGHGNIDPATFLMQVSSSGTYYDITCDNNGELVDGITDVTQKINGRVDLIKGVISILTGGLNRFEASPSSSDVLIDYDYETVVQGATTGEVKHVYANQGGTNGKLSVDNYVPAVGEFTIDLGENADTSQVSVVLKLTRNVTNGTTEYSMNSGTDITLVVREINGVHLLGAYVQWEQPNKASGLTLHSLASSTLPYYNNGRNRYFQEWGSVSINGLVTLKLPRVYWNGTSSDWTGTDSGKSLYLILNEIVQLKDVDDPVEIVYRSERPVTYSSSGSKSGKIEAISEYKIKTHSNIVSNVSFYFPDIHTRNYSEGGVVYHEDGSQIGTINKATGEINLGYRIPPTDFHLDFESLVTDTVAVERTVVTPSSTKVIQPSELTTTLAFRTAATKLTTSSFQMRYETITGSYTATSDNNGVLTGDDLDLVNSYVDTETGMVSLVFENPVIPESVKYDAVAESSLPLDPQLLGLNPVRIPADGRIPIFKSGYVLIIFNEKTTPVANGTPVANQVDAIARSGQAYIEVIDSEGKRLDPTQYVADRNLGTVTFTDPLVLEDKYGNPLTAPFSIIDRIEDMVMSTDVEINGQIQLSGALSHDFPKDDTKVASALVWGDIGARTYNLFSQEIWNNGNPEWSDSLIGDPTTAQYDTINYPIQIDNKSSTAGRWAIIFTGSTTVKIAEEKLGVVDQNVSISVDDVAPINPATGEPYFLMPKEGFGLGWTTNNVIRFNTDSGDANMWLIRTVQSGALSEEIDHIDVEIRGDAN